MLNFLKRKPNAGIITFLGTNCDRDTKMALEATGFKAQYVFHTDTDFKGFDLIVLPGGFSFGDYIGAGRLAKLSPAVIELQNEIGRKFILGICNGFQILCEGGFLPGALISNRGAKFISRDEKLTLCRGDEPVTLPIAHKEGLFWAEDEVLSEIEAKKQVFARYSNNPNGSLNDIAGLYDEGQKILGLMPHPERAVLKECGLVDGRKIFKFIRERV